VCGQKDEPLKRSLKDLALEFFQHPLIDAKLWRTLPHLLRPGALTEEYLSGRRTRYVRPLKLYLTVSVLFFALFSLRVPAAEAFKVEVDPDPVPGAVAQPEKAHWHFPIRWLDERFESSTHRLEGPGGAAARQALSLRIAGLVPKMVFVLLPLSAVLFKLFWWKRYFIEHLVFTLHLHSFVFAAGLLTLLSTALLPVFFLWTAAYGLLAFKAVYKSGWWVTVAKVTGVGCCYLLLLSAVLLGTAFSALLAS